MLRFKPRISYDQTAVESVIQDLQDVEEVPPTLTGSSREPVTLHHRKDTEAMFEAMKELVTYRVNAVRTQSALRRLMGLGRGLTQDQVDAATRDKVKDQIVKRMGQELQRLRKSGELETRARKITDLQLRTVAVRGPAAAEEQAAYTVESASADVDRHFEQAGRLLGNDLHMEYWRSFADREADEVKVEVVVVSQDLASMQTIEEYAEKEFDRLYTRYKRDIANLKEQRRKHYERLRLAPAVPQDIPWQLPDSVGWSRPPKAPHYDRHLYVEDDGKFRVELGNWEREALIEELQNTTVVGWFRNLDRKQWSLEVPYRTAEQLNQCFPTW